MPELARLALLIILLAAFWNLARGTFRPWLRAKFLGEAVTPRRPGARTQTTPQGQIA